MKNYYKTFNDIEEFMRANPRVNYRYFVQASSNPIPINKIIDFSTEMTQKVIDLGKKDSEAVINLGPGIAFKRFLNGIRSNEDKEKTSSEFI
jgi:hypothetical protein